VGLQRVAALGPNHSSNKEHFGFRDGISQPTPKGSGLESSSTEIAWPWHRASSS
jgi:deferrochelatase/peroxidase EfeB